jgi:penicillin-binding protein 1A
MRLRTALVKSKNLVSIRILQAIGPQYAQDYVKRFGFDPKNHPPYLTMALGAGNATPLQMAQAYSVFANGGYRVVPYFIERIEDNRGNVLAQAQPPRAGDSADRVIDERNAFIMQSIMRDVVRVGTAGRAMKLGRGDLGGKTGTTNDFIDAWFCGFNPSLVAVAWIGFDQPQTLGRGETGGVAALPIWMGYMGVVLKGTAEQPFTPPPGVMTVRVDPDTGMKSEGGGISEYFFQEFGPPEGGFQLGASPAGAPGSAFPTTGDRPIDDLRQPLF